MVVRNAMEEFHCEHLSDSQMKELNPIVRNAVYEALYFLAMASYPFEDEDAQEVVASQLRVIPEYWEDPKSIQFGKWKDRIQEIKEM